MTHHALISMNCVDSNQDVAILRTMNNIKTATQNELAEMLTATSSDIRWAEAAGRSTSTINRLWRRYFQIEDAIKAFRGWA